VKTYQYDVFGAVRTQTGTQPNEFTFTGEQVDTSGLQYLRARYYDAATGRFANRDPLPLVQRYAYVGGNPANLVDPSGEFPCPGCDKLKPGSGLADAIGSRVGAVAVIALDGTNAALQTSAAFTTDGRVLYGCLMGLEAGAAAGMVGAAGGCLVGGTAAYLLAQSQTAPQRAAGFGARGLAANIKLRVGCDPEGAAAPVFPPGAQVDPTVSAIYAWNALYNDLPWAWDTLIHGR
jgi:RHS repeat-associated protein